MSDLGKHLPLWSAVPFVGILLSIALFPLFAPHFWHHHFPKISALWAVVFAVPFLIAYKGEAFHEILHIYLADYIPFIILLLGLFTASGGILLRGTLAGTPVVNTVILIIGTVLASWMGTTGAAMLLIRPLIRANKKRKNRMHQIIFFIFLVANIGGSLTPLGDPPLFLGFLHGVPFFWTFAIFPHFIFTAVLLLIIFFVLDSILYKREGGLPDIEDEVKEPLKVEGIHNLLFLMGVMGFVLFSGMVRLPSVNILGVHVPWQNIIRELGIVLMVVLSMLTTKKKIRTDNEFTWFPIKEVAYLFAGIFMTIIPALAMLRAGTDGALRPIVEFVKEPIHYFWITGSLSAFLDNAPTYLTFFNLAEGRLGLNDAMVAQILRGTMEHPNAAQFVSYLKGIAAGAVFFGAATYIGNAPNFMVRSISEENKIKMPSFFGYMLWSIGFLVPVFILVSFIFFR
ncbi:sodium:proton antiporter [bacterium]|nr:sodium:proton antiporter [bacterium]